MYTKSIYLSTCIYIYIQLYIHIQLYIISVTISVCCLETPHIVASVLRILPGGVPRRMLVPIAHRGQRWYCLLCGWNYYVKKWEFCI